MGASSFCHRSFFSFNLCSPRLGARDRCVWRGVPTVVGGPHTCTYTRPLDTPAESRLPLHAPRHTHAVLRAQRVLFPFIFCPPPPPFFFGVHTIPTHHSHPVNTIQTRHAFPAALSHAGGRGGGEGGGCALLSPGKRGWKRHGFFFALLPPRPPFTRPPWPAPPRPPPRAQW